MLSVHIAGHSRFNEVNVCNPQLGHLPNDIRELRDGIGHPHVVVRTPRAQTNLRPLRPHGVTHGAHSLDRETGAVPHAAPVLVPPVVSVVGQELLDQVPVGAVQLDAVETVSPVLSGVGRRSSSRPTVPELTILIPSAAATSA